MFMIFIFILYFNIFANAEQRKFSDFDAKDLDGQDVSFAKYHGKCVLVFNLEFYYILRNINFLNSLKEKPDLDIIVFPNKCKMTNKELKGIFFDYLKVEFDVMEPIDFADTEIKNFLIERSEEEYQQNSNQMISDYYKFLVEKDGLSVTRYDLDVHIYKKYMLQYGLEKCLVERVENFKDYNGINLKDEYITFTQYEDKCVIVFYADIKEKDHMVDKMEDLLNFKKKFTSLEIVVFPKAYYDNTSQDYRSSYIDFANSLLNPDLINFMATIYNRIQDTTIYRFLIERAEKNEDLPDPDVFFVAKNGLTVKIIDDLSYPSLGNLVISNNCH